MLEIRGRILLKFKGSVDDKQIKKLQFDLLHRFGKEIFQSDNHVVERVVKFQHADGVITPGKDETLASVNLACRVYRQGYERGPGGILASLVLYLTRELGDVEVWYGGDAGGVELERYTPQKALDLLWYYNKVGRMPYLTYLAGTINPDDPTASPDCPSCSVPMLRSAAGDESMSWYCAGCGRQITYQGQQFLDWTRGEDPAPEEPSKVLSMRR